MAELTAEQFEQVPEFLKADYVQDGEVYRHASDLKVGKLKSSLDGLDAKLKDFEKNEQSKIEAARTQALEEAKSKGDVKAVEERYQQQMADLEKRVREEAKGEALNEFKTQQATEKASALAEKIGLTLGVDTDAAENITDLIRGRIKIDPQTGKKIFHDAKGSALSVDEAGFMKELAKEKRFARLVKPEVVVQGGGMANGNTGGSASVGTNNAAAEAARKKGDTRGYLDAMLKQQL